ncbi:MAG: protein TolQ [Deltaproteobacteria bacterium]|nr:protein TolQ [Deltaproteobacteria bacterium]
MEESLNADMWSMIASSGPVVKATLLTLVGLSIWSWTITIAKTLQFWRARKASDEFSTIFWDSRNLSRIDDSARQLSVSPLAQVFASGYKELGQLMQDRDKRADEEGYGRIDEIEVLERSLRKAQIKEGLKLEKGVTFLATVASAAPFIGLFGTVWGIMNAFNGLSQVKNTTISAVAPGISEALITTAIGLAAAIPAAVAYNYFVVAIRYFKEQMEAFNSEFLSIAARFFVK